MLLLITGLLSLSVTTPAWAIVVTDRDGASHSDYHAFTGIPINHGDPNMPPLDHDGVAWLEITYGGGAFGFFGAGVLLKGGEYVLTAAHLVTVAGTIAVDRRWCCDLLPKP